MRSVVALLLLTQAVSSFGDFERCNTTHSCWFHPPECAENSRTKCVSGVMWQTVEEGVEIEWLTHTNDLSPTRGAYWAAVGFSEDQRMGDDTVIECVHPSTGTEGDRGTVRVSFNDETSNAVLWQASSVLLSSSSSSLVDGLLTCKTTLLFNRTSSVDPYDQFKIHDIENQPYHMLFARGNADPRSMEKDIHSTGDGALFPWMTEEKISLSCPSLDPASCHVAVSDMRQTIMERYWRYRVALLHGVAMLLAWWVLGSNAIIIARYFKPLFPRRKLLGTAVWFQFHRDMFLVSLVLQILAVVFIFYQANWVWYECSYQCTSDDFAKKMHAITGVWATALAVCQPFLAAVRPSPDSRFRPIFNWAHWLVGMTAFAFASGTFILSLPLGKTGLNYVWGHVPNYIMGGYIIFFILCNVVLEMISSNHDVRVEKIGVSGMSLSAINGPTTEHAMNANRRTSSRLFVFFIHLAVSLGVAITITVMLVKNLYSHAVSPY